MVSTNQEVFLSTQSDFCGLYFHAAITGEFSRFLRIYMLWKHSFRVKNLLSKIALGIVLSLLKTKLVITNLLIRVDYWSESIRCIHNWVFPTLAMLHQNKFWSFVNAAFQKWKVVWYHISKIRFLTQKDGFYCSLIIIFQSRERQHKARSISSE